MKQTLIILALIIILPLAYFAYKFSEAKNICDSKVVKSLSATYQDPGAEAKRGAAHNAVLTSPECTQVASFAKFVELSLRGQ